MAYSIQSIINQFNLATITYFFYQSFDQIVLLQQCLTLLLQVIPLLLPQSYHDIVCLHENVRLYQSRCTFSLLLTYTNSTAITMNKNAALYGLKTKFRTGRSKQFAASKLNQQKIHFLALFLEQMVASSGTRQATMKVGTKMRKRTKLFGPASATVSVTTGSTFSIIIQYLYIISRILSYICSSAPTFILIFQLYLSSQFGLYKQQQTDMKENLLGKSVTHEEQPSLQSQRYSYPSTGRVSNYTQPLPKAKKVPSKKIVETVRDESYELQMQNYGIFRKIIGLYQRFPVLNPQGTAMLLWNIVNFIIIIFYLLEIGLLIGFGQPFWNDQLTYFYAGNMIFVVFFILDILISPLKAYYQNGILVTSRVAILKRYYQLYLWLDLIALVSIIAPYVSLSLSTNYFKLLFASKLLTAYELDKYLLIHIYGLSRLVLLIILWAHWFGIGFFALDYWVYTSNYYGPNTPNYCWIYNSPLSVNISETYWYIQYLYSLYFSIGNISTIAYGDVVPRNPIQCFYIVFAMTFAVLLFTYFFKEMIELIFESSAEEIDSKQSFSVIKSFLINNKVHKTLATKIKFYFQTNWLHYQLKNKQIEEELIQKLPKQLKIQLHFAYYTPFITQLGIIPPGVDISSHNTRSPFLCELSAAIETEKVMAGQLLYSQGEAFQQHQYVFFTCKEEGELTVTQGVGCIDWPHAELFLQEHKSQEDLQLLYGKSIVLKNLIGLFGEESFFLQSERSHWAISNRHMELLKLSRSKFAEFLNKFGGKNQKQQVCLTIENIQHRYCLICKQRGHMFSKCNYVTYIPHQKQILDQLKSQNMRTNNQMITRQRESWVNFTTKQNSWKLYLELKSSRKKHGSEYQQRLRQQQEDKDEHINEHLFEELAVLQTLLKQHISKEIQAEDRQGLNVDEGVSYSVYKPKFNIEEEVKKYNYYTDKSKNKKFKD